MVARVAVLVVAIAAVVFGVAHLHRAHTCQSAFGGLGRALAHHRVPAGGLDAQLDVIADNCPDQSIEGASFAMTTVDERARAIRLANILIHRSPRSQFGYIALATALATAQPQRAAAALARAHALNPRAVVPPLPDLGRLRAPGRSSGG